MDLTDGTLVVLGKSKSIGEIFTLDNKDFKVYRPAHRKGGNCFLLGIDASHEPHMTLHGEPHAGSPVHRSLHCCPLRAR